MRWVELEHGEEHESGTEQGMRAVIVQASHPLPHG